LTKKYIKKSPFFNGLDDFELYITRH